MHLIEFPILARVLGPVIGGDEGFRGAAAPCKNRCEIFWSQVHCISEGHSAVSTLASMGRRVPASRRPPQDAANFVMMNRRKLVRSFHASLLAIILIPCLSAAQEKSEPASSSSENPESTPGKIVKAPGRAVGASARALGKLFKHEPAQPSGVQPEPRGLVSFVQLQGTSTPLGLVMSLDMNLGYNLTSHFGADVGLPLFLVRSPFSPYTDRRYSWTALWGDPYIDLRYKTARSGLNLTSVLTGTIPASSPERVFTTGRFGVDWFNHVEGKLKGFTPFVNFGAANGTVNRYYMPRPYSMARPYQTLGFISDFEGGAHYQMRPGFKIGASAYALVPGGPQTVFSRLVAPGSSVVGDYDHNRYFYHAFQTMSQRHLDLNEDYPLLGSKIARDNGFSGWLEIGNAHNVTLLIGYTRSVHYAYDALNVGLNFNTTSLIKFLATPRR
jgi:hypothetical protein